MATLHDFLEPVLSGLTTAGTNATSIHTTIASSAKTFFNNGEVLTGNIEGKGANACFNAFAINNQHCQLLIDKINDYCNVTSSLKNNLESITELYDTYNSPYPSYATTDINTNTTAEQIWERLRTAFVNGANLHLFLTPGTASAAIPGPIDAERDQIILEIDQHFQQYEQPLEDKLNHSKPGDLGYGPTHLDLMTLQGQQGTAHQMVMGIASSMQTRLHSWASELQAPIQAYIAEVEAAAKIYHFSLSDLIYEANLPQNAKNDVLIEQLPGGGLLIVVTGGTPGGIEQKIKTYLQMYGYGGQHTPVTIVGYANGESVAQAIIKDAQNSEKHLPLKVTNAIMLGGKPQNPDGMPTNYFGYTTMPEGDQPEGKKRPWWEPTNEQMVTMGLTLLLAIPTEGGSLLLEGEEITAATVGKAALKIGVDKVEDYAVALGYDATHHEESAEQFLANKLNAFPAYAQDLEVSKGKGTPISLDAYIKKNQGINIKDPKLKFYYRGLTILPDETGLDTRTLKNDAYLGTQPVPAPTGVSKQGEGVSKPIQGDPLSGTPLP